MNHEHGSDSGNRTKSGTNWMLFGFLLLAAYFLFGEYGKHLFEWLSSYGIWLLLLACPLMHLFMHGGHGKHGSHRDDRR